MVWSKWCCTLSWVQHKEQLGRVWGWSPSLHALSFQFIVKFEKPRGGSGAGKGVLPKCGRSPPVQPVPRGAQGECWQVWRG